MSDLIIERVSTYAAEFLPSVGLELVEVQFRREQHGWVLRVFIDTKDGVNFDHCSLVSRQLGDYLDVEDVIEHAYHLEVSSPGLERKLFTIEDFKRFCGKKTKIKLHQAKEGKKSFVGVIADVEEDTIVLMSEDGVRWEIAFDMVSTARLAI